MFIMASISDRLRAAREQAGFEKATDAARRFGWPEPTYLSHENGSRGLRAGVVERYAKAFKVSPEWLQFGDGEVPQMVDIGETPPDGAELVPVYDVTASAGYGAVVDAEDHICNMAFDRGFLRMMTDAKGQDLAIIRVKGHSMEPTLLDDDHVLVDRTKTNLDFDGLFVVRFGDALHVKRIGRSAMRGNVMVTSDHPGYRPLDMPKAEIDVVGRVLWYGRKV